MKFFSFRNILLLSACLILGFNQCIFRINLNFNNLKKNLDTNSLEKEHGKYNSQESKFKIKNNNF